MPLEEAGALLYYGLGRIAEADKAIVDDGDVYQTKLESVHVSLGIAYFLLESLATLPIPRVVGIDVVTMLVAAQPCLLASLYKHPLHSSSQFTLAAGAAPAQRADERHVSHVMSQARGLLARLALPPPQPKNTATGSSKIHSGPGKAQNAEVLTPQQLSKLPMTIPMMGALRRLVVRANVLIQPASQLARLPTFIPTNMKSRVSFSLHRPTVHC
jgi:hypothetical protein